MFAPESVPSLIVEHVQRAGASLESLRETQERALFRMGRAAKLASMAAAKETWVSVFVLAALQAATRRAKLARSGPARDHRTLSLVPLPFLHFVLPLPCDIFTTVSLESTRTTFQ